MKMHIKGFLRRGIFSCGIGPLVLAVIYLIMQHEANLQSLTVRQVCIGIFSLAVLAFVAGGLNEIYQIERLPLMVAITIHGGALYISYLITYLVNGWLEWGRITVLAFTGIFVVGYMVIWAAIYGMMKTRTARVNEMLQEKQRREKTAL